MSADHAHATYARKRSDSPPVKLVQSYVELIRRYWWRSLHRMFRSGAAKPVEMAYIMRRVALVVLGQ